MTAFQLIRKDSALKNLFGWLILFLAIAAYGEYYRGALDVKMRIAEDEIKSRMVVIERARREEQLFSAQVASLPKLAKKSEVDALQESLINKLRAYKLELNAMQPISAPANPTPSKEQPVSGQDYEVTVLGNWNDTVKYLNDLKAEKHLITLLMLRMESTSNPGEIRTTFRYKIYVERGI